MMKTDTAISGDPAQMASRAAAAEHRGFDGVWVAETAHDPFLALGLAATQTDRVALGTNIAVAFARSPMTVAMTANDLHALSGGRFALGLGSQVKPHITRRFSMPWSSPAARMKEYVEALRAIWRSWNTGERLRFTGEFYRHTLMTPMFSPPPNPHGAPPVYVAAVGPRMLAVAAEVADGLLVHPFTTERYLREVIVPAIIEVRGTLEGFEIAGMPIVVSGTDAAALERSMAAAKSQIAFYASTPAYRPLLELHGWGGQFDELHGLSVRGKWAEMADRLPADLVETIAVVASPTELGAAVQARYGDVFTRCSLPCD